jgi:hypothetical protein
MDNLLPTSLTKATMDFWDEVSHWLYIHITVNEGTARYRHGLDGFDNIRW